MDIKSIMKNIDLVKRLIEKEEDLGKLKELKAELEQFIEDFSEAKAEEKYTAKVEAEKAAAEKEAAEKEVKEFREKARKAPAGNVEVVANDEYKGVKLKAVLKGFRDRANKNVKAMIDADYAAAEGVAKAFAEMTLSAIDNPSRKNMVEGTPASGGYIVPSEERMEILAYMRETSIALQDARIESMNTDTMTFPRESGTVNVAVRSEGSAVTATSATFGQVTLNTKNLDAYVPVSKELVMDEQGMPALVSMLMSQFFEAVGKKVDSAVFNAPGTVTDGSGLFQAAGYSEVFGTGSSNFSALLSTNLTNIIGKVFATPQDTSRLAWYGHPSVIWQYIRGLQDANENFVFSDPVGGDPGRILGWPVRNVYQAAAATAASTVLIGFGDLTAAIVGERLSTISMFYDPYGDAINGMDRFFLFTRFAFANAQPNKFGRVLTAS